jgi:hypothetical protein
MYPDSQAFALPPGSAASEISKVGKGMPAKTASGKRPNRQVAKPDQPFPQDWNEIGVDHLVLAKQDGPWGGWWEAIPIEDNGDHLSLRWRDYPNLPTFVRRRFSLALLCPKA